MGDFLNIVSKPGNGMIFRVVDIEAMGFVGDLGPEKWPWLMEALSRAESEGAIEIIEPCIHKRYDQHGGCLCRVQPDWMTGGEGIRGRHNEFSGSEYEPFHFTACNHPPPCPGAGIVEEPE